MNMDLDGYSRSADESKQHTRPFLIGAWGENIAFEDITHTTSSDLLREEV